jgi:hypothetical protein
MSAMAKQASVKVDSGFASSSWSVDVVTRWVLVPFDA